jgi:deoxyribonuclease IV
MLIGGHVSSAGGLVKALARAEEMGCETMQIFIQSPRAWRPNRYTPSDIESFRARFAESPIDSVFIHAVYLINVASDDAEKRRKSLEALTKTLAVGDAIGAAGVIVHPGSGRGASHEETIEMIGSAFTRALATTESCRLILENTAGAGFTVGRHFDELADVMESVGRDERLGVCLDSCHLLASGHEVREAGALAELIDEYDAKLALDCLRCLHLNDSATPLGSNSDRHAILGEGELGEDGLRVFLGEPRFQGLPVLLETGPAGHGPDKRQIEIAKRLRDEARDISPASPGAPNKQERRPKGRRKSRTQATGRACSRRSKAR